MITLTALDRNLREFVLLRYVMIIAVSYLVISQRGSGAVSPAAALLVAAALGSNVLLGTLRPKHLSALQVAGILVLIDTVWLSLSLALIQHVGTEFFFLYFFVLFFAALSESLVLMLVGVIAASGAYLWVLAQLRPGTVWTQEHMLQITFLFSAAVFYGVLVNRTRQRRHEAELMEAADGERTQLLATLAHDIGGPAHVISLGLEQLEETLEHEHTGADVSSLFAAVSRNSGYLKQLAMRFIEYSKLRSGRYELHPCAIPVGALVERVAAQHAIDARARSVELTVTITPIPPAMLDELALVRTLSNLIDNAIRYSQAGAAVTIDAGRDGDEIVIEVADSGPGMGAEQRADIGKPFVTTAKTQGGSGLGLFIVRSLVEAQGGSLQTASEPGAGARFTVRLPLIAPPLVIDSPAADRRGDDEVVARV